MPLTIDAQKSMMKALKFSDADIATATGDGENDITIPDGTKVFAADEYTTLEKNLSEKGKKTNIKAGMEIAVKNMKETLGLEYDGKDLDTFLEKAEEHFISAAKLPAGEAKKQWEVEKKTLQDKLTEAAKKITEVENDKRAIEFDTTLLKKFPADRSTDLSDEDRLLLLKNKLQRSEEDGKEYFNYNGARLQDDKLNDLSIDSAIAHVFKTEKGWTGKAADAPPAGHGHGDGNTKPGFFKSTADFRAHLQAKGIGLNTPEAKTALAAAMATNPKMEVGG